MLNYQTSSMEAIVGMTPGSMAQLVPMLGTGYADALRCSNRLDAAAVFIKKGTVAPVRILQRSSLHFPSERLYCLALIAGVISSQDAYSSILIHIAAHNEEVLRPQGHAAQHCHCCHSRH